MQEKITEWLLARVGEGYIYGAKGQKCTPAFRNQQANQYPDQQNNILNVGEKWDGKPVWDCAQLTRAAAAVGGVSLKSGATSQYNAGPWKQTGTIDTIPAGRVVFVYRDSGGRKQHTGASLGDGTVVEARGTAKGVIRSRLTEYPWTHWAEPYWQAESEERPMQTVTMYVETDNGGALNLRDEPSKSARRLAVIPNGAAVDVLTDQGEWAAVNWGDQTGYVMTAFLTPEKREKSAQEQASDVVALYLDRQTAETVLTALCEALEVGEE